MYDTTKSEQDYREYWRKETARRDKRRGKYRFKLYGFDEIAAMTHEEWNERCRRDGCDMNEHPEDAAVIEIIAMQEAKKLGDQR